MAALGDREACRAMEEFGHYAIAARDLSELLSEHLKNSVQTTACIAAADVRLHGTAE